NRVLVHGRAREAQVRLTRVPEHDEGLAAVVADAEEVVGPVDVHEDAEHARLQHREAGHVAGGVRLAVPCRALSRDEQSQRGEDESADSLHARCIAGSADRPGSRRAAAGPVAVPQRLSVNALVAVTLALPLRVKVLVPVIFRLFAFRISLRAAPVSWSLIVPL